MNFLMSHAVPKAMTLAQIQQATAEDTLLQSLAEMIHIGKFDETKHADISKIKDELTVNDESNIILRDICIVMSASLQD